MTPKKGSYVGPGGLLAEKKAQIERNRRDFLGQLKLATEEALEIMLICRPNIERAFHERPMESREVVVYRSGPEDRACREDVETAARLLRHPAMGYEVRASTLREGGLETHLITYRHKSIIED